ncbi:MAG TPA: hypothetical protein VL863_11110 [bacterium]|nr:hypothetical protein [bacterium]
MGLFEFGANVSMMDDPMLPGVTFFPAALTLWSILAAMAVAS